MLVVSEELVKNVVMFEASDKVVSHLRKLYPDARITVEISKDSTVVKIDDTVITVESKKPSKGILREG